MEIYKDYQKEEQLIAKIKVIEKVGETLPFLIEDSTTRRDVTHYGIKYKGEVIKSYCNHLKEGDIRIFTKRRVYGIGLINTTLSHKNNTESQFDRFTILPYDSFLKVNGKEIY